MSKTLKKDSDLLQAHRFNGQQGKYKKFDQEAFNKHNGPAVNAVLSYLDSVDTWAKENDDKYGPDIVVYESFRPAFYIEVEQPKAWTTGDWRWDPVHIPERKGHMYKSLSLPCEHWIIRADLSSCIILPDATLREHGTLQEFSNSKIKSGELFYHIPLEHWIQKELIHGQL